MDACCGVQDGSSFDAGTVAVTPVVGPGCDFRSNKSATLDKQEQTSFDALQALVLKNCGQIKELEDELKRVIAAHAKFGGAADVRLSDANVDVDRSTTQKRPASTATGAPDAGAGVGRVDADSPDARARPASLQLGTEPMRTRRRGALCAAALLAALGMPFGPVGMVAGCVLGAFVGGAVGYCIDRRLRYKQLKDSEVTKRRLESVSRWAMARAHDPEEVKTNLEFVILEFKPVADIAGDSRIARKLLRLLDKWVSNKTVTRAIWVFMDDFLSRWRSCSRDDIIRVMHIFQTLSTMYKYNSRNLGEFESRFVMRIERLIRHQSVEAAMTRANLSQSSGDSRVIESIKSLDHRRGGDSPRSRSRGDSGFGRICEEDELLDSDEEGEPMAPENADESSHPGSIGSPSSMPASATSQPAPLFKSWDDFMEFDLNIKRKIPITGREFDFLLEKETEGDKNWELCVDRKEIRVMKQMAGTGTVFVRAWATLPGVDMLAAFHLFYDINMRLKWDSVFAEMKLAPETVKGSDVLYSSLRIPFVTPRDFLQYRRVRVLPDNSIVIVLRSAEHPDFPEVKGSIRAESYISGYVLRQSFDENGKPVLSLFLMACTDVKGLIPKWIINSAAPKKPAEWVDSLKKFAQSYQESNPGYREELGSILDRFRDAQDDEEFGLSPRHASALKSEDAPVPALPDLSAL